MTTEQNTLIQLKLMNMIKDGDSMEYVTPNKDFKFLIDRYDSAFSNTYGNRYVIETKVFNMIGTCISIFRINESECIRLLDTLDAFLNDIDGSMFGYNLSMPFSPQQGTFCYYIFEITRIHIDLEYIDTVNQKYLVTENYDDIRDIVITLKQVSVTNPNHIVPVFNFNTSDAELKDFMFSYFFVGLIDLELDTRDEAVINAVLSNWII